MKNSERDRFDVRLKNATQAKQNMLERFQVAADDPERQAKRARRDEVADAREAKRQSKAAQLLKEREELEQQQIEDAKRAKEQAAEREVALELERAETAERVSARAKALEAERKAERDRRYAARRSRKR